MLATMKIEAAPKREARDGHQQHNHVHVDHHEHDHEHAADVSEYVRLGLMGLVIVASLTGWWRHWMLRDWLAFTATLVGGFPIFKEAWENLRKRRMTMELSMTLALVAALCIGQFLTALVIAFFVLFAEMVEGYTVGSGRRAIQTLIDALPRQVRVRRGDEERELGTNEIVEQAEKSRAPVQRIADRLAAGLVYFAFGAAAFTLIVTRNFTSSIAVIIVAGACGVAAGTPLAI